MKTYASQDKAFHALYIINLLSKAVKPAPPIYQSLAEAKQKAPADLISIVNALTTYQQDCLTARIESML